MLNRDNFDTQVEYDLYLAEDEYDRYNQCMSDCQACKRKQKTALKKLKRVMGKYTEYLKRHGRTVQTEVLLK